MLGLIRTTIVRKSATRQRSVRVLIGAWFAGLVVVAALPTLVALTPLRHVVLCSVLHKESGTCEVGRMRLGWFANLDMSDVVIRGPNAQPLLQAARISVDRSLWEMLFPRGDFGTVLVDRPQLHVRFREGTSNVETFIRPWLENTGSSSSIASCNVKLREAHVLWEDERSQHVFSAATGEISLRDTDQLRCALHSDVLAPSPGPRRDSAGHFTFEATCNITRRTGQIEFASRQFPLEAIQPIVGRWWPDATLGGTLTSELLASSDDRGGRRTVDIEGEISSADCHLDAPTLGGDTLRLTTVRLPCKLRWQNATLHIDKLEVDCDLGTVRANGVFPLKDLTARGVSRAVRQAEGSVDARIDLARVSQTLPSSLRLREDTRVDDGTVTVHLQARRESDGRFWSGRMATDRIAATRGDRSLHWDDPLEVEFRARQEAERLVVDHLACRSDFLEIDGAGTPQRLRVTTRVNLDHMTRQLGQFIDFGEVTLSGRGEGTVAWRCSADGQFRTEFQGQTDDLHLAGLQFAWSEKVLQAQGMAEGTLDATGLHVDIVRTFWIELAAAGDRARLDLRDAFERTSQRPVKFDVVAEGDLQRWLARLPLATRGSRPLAEGTLRLDAHGAWGEDRIQLLDASAVVTDFRTRHGAWNIAQSHVKARGGGSWHRGGPWLVDALRIEGPALAIRSDPLQMTWDATAGPRFSGTIACRVDSDSLRAWAGRSALVDALPRRASIEGEARLESDGKRLSAAVQVPTPPHGPSAAAPRRAGQDRPDTPPPSPKFKAVLAYDWGTGDVNLQSVDAAYAGIRLTADVETTPQDQGTGVQLAGTLHYDMEEVTAQLIRPRFADQVRLAGRDSSPFSLTTSLGPESLAASLGRAEGLAGLAWQRAEVFGFPIGAGRLQADIGQGRLETRPLETDVAGGRLQSQLTLAWRPPPAELTLQPGKLLQNVAITKPSSDAALQYIAPILAGALEMEGRFSMDVASCRVPLEEPPKADMSGLLRLHSMRIVPGPVARQLIELGRQIESMVKTRGTGRTRDATPQTLLHVHENDVEFRVQAGRVYHRGLTFRVGDAVFVTHGSVGLDESLAVMVETQIADAWVQNDPVLQHLRGQTVRIPVHGTLSRPAVDQRSLAQASVQLFQGTAERALGDALGKQLDKLFRSR